MREAAEPPAYRVDALTVDSGDAPVQARWWADVLDGEVHHVGAPYWSLGEVPGMPFDFGVFPGSTS